MGSVPVSVLHGLVLHKLVIYPMAHKGDEAIQRLCPWPIGSLKDLRTLSILGKKVSTGTLSRIMHQCPQLERLEARLDCIGRSSGLLLNYIAGEHHLTNVELQGAELRWLHHFRRCRRVVLSSCPMAEYGYPLWPSFVAHVTKICSGPINLEELNLGLIITDVRTCAQANSVIEYIKLNTTEQTRITITASKDSRDSDSPGTPEITLSQLSDDGDDSDSSNDSADSGESTDREKMTPEQRKEMKRAHKAILRYAASERARWS
jgi:hypothetical protein